MKIQRIEVHNLKANRDLAADLNGKHVLITADNGRGKTSLLQALYVGLGIKSMAPPVTEGEQEGEVTVWTDEGFTFHTEVDRVKGVTKVSVKHPNEKKFDERVSAVGSVVGDILFDPFEFAELSKSTAGKKKQIDEVESLLTEEEREALNKMRLQIKANEEGRLAIGQELKVSKGAVEAMGITRHEIDTYKEPVSVTELTEKKNAITAKNTEINSVQGRFDERAKKIEALEAELSALKQKQTEAEKFLSENKVVSTVALDSDIADASRYNTMVDKVKSYQKEFDKLTKLENQYGECTSLIETQRELLKQTVRELDLPIPDLTFDYEQLMFQGRAVDPNVMSTSEIMYLGCMIQIAKQPGVKVLVIPRGESLGTQKLNDLIDLSDTYGFQLLVEQVVRGQEELKIEFLTKQ